MFDTRTLKPGVRIRVRLDPMDVRDGCGSTGDVKVLTVKRVTQIGDVIVQEENEIAHNHVSWCNVLGLAEDSERKAPGNFGWEWLRPMLGEDAVRILEAFDGLDGLSLKPERREAMMKWLLSHADGEDILTIIKGGSK